MKFARYPFYALILFLGALIICECRYLNNAQVKFLLDAFDDTFAEPVTELEHPA
jgi:hypothetical protein